MKIFLVIKVGIDDELVSQHAVFATKEAAEEVAKKWISNELSWANLPEPCNGHDDEYYPAGTILYSMDGECACEIWKAGEAAEYDVFIRIEELELN